MITIVFGWWLAPLAITALMTLWVLREAIREGDTEGIPWLFLASSPVTLSAWLIWALLKVWGVI